MKTILLKKWTSVTDIAAWCEGEPQQVEFTITKSSSFCFLAEQFALPAVAHLRRSGCVISVKCGSSQVSALSGVVGEIALFRSLFGLQLAYAAFAIIDALGEDVTTLTRK